jgi:hypothetical protein
MPLAAENFVQENSGVISTPGTSCVVSVPSGTTDGNTVLIVLKSSMGPTAPAGFAEDKAVGSFLRVYRKSEVAAGETSWTFTTASNSLFDWYVAEVSGIGLVEPLDASASTVAAPAANGGTVTSGTAPLNASLNTVVLAAFGSASIAGDTHSWSGYTNGFDEVVDIGPSPVSGFQLAVARKFVTGQTDQFECTATFATSGSTTSADTLLVAYRAADSPIAAPLAMLAGFEWGTHGGITATTGDTAMLGNPIVTTGTWDTNYLIQAGSARNSGYGLRIVQSAAATAVRLGNLAGGSASCGFNVRVVSASGTVSVAYIATNIGSVLAQLLYDTSTSKFGVRCGSTGTVSWQPGTTAINTWVWVDLRVKVNISTWHAEWRLETATDTYTDQTAADLSGQSPATVSLLTLGNANAQTMTADYDDVVLSRYYVAYPLGPHQIRLLTVDPAGTPTVSGTSTNFSVFTANGTLGAWNATNARDAVDEVPPTVSASADGVCQTAVAANDYIEFPMAAPTVAADEIIAGVRELAAMWGGTGTGTGTVGIRGWDGTTETILVAASVSYDAGSPTAYSTTEPRWQCAMWPFPTGGWTEALLAGAALRFGFSTDATPDMGCDALYLEYAARKTVTSAQFGDLVASASNPNTAGIRSITTTPPAGYDATLHYEESGSPTDVATPGGTTTVEVIDAPDAPAVNYVAAYPPPEDISDA